MASIYEIRVEHYITRAKLASVAGISQSSLVRLETTDTKAQRETVEKVLVALSQLTGEELNVGNVDGISIYNPALDHPRCGGRYPKLARTA